jgi:hypothetical protein
MIPEQIGANLFRASAIGARQFVVQDAAEMIVSAGVRVLWLVLKTMVGRSLPAGAEITTFFAPALI